MCSADTPSNKTACATSTDTDRLSDLPDVLLSYILSFLRAREAMQTCVLSKRWRGLWAYTPSVLLDYYEFGYGNGIDQKKFTSFVDALFIHRKIPNIDSFQLHWFHLSNSTDPSIASTCIHRAVTCKPRSVYLNLGNYESTELPGSLFTCASIEEMTLMFFGSMGRPKIEPESIILPCLRNLTLAGITLGNDVTKKLTQGCRVLETMTMRQCELHVTDISSPCLRSLVIEHCTMEPNQVCISMPNLVALRIKRIESGMITLRNMSSLLKASLSLCDVESRLMNHKKRKYHELLSGLSNATHIELSEFCSCALIRGIWAREFSKCPSFKNLKSLYLNECFLCQDFYLIAWFIHLAPNLEKLILRPRENLISRWKHHEEDDRLNDEVTSRLDMPLQFKCRQLEVEIQHRENVRVQELVQKFKENFKTLKKISTTALC